jgi:hypothetical protein
MPINDLFRPHDFIRLVVLLMVVEVLSSDRSIVKELTYCFHYYLFIYLFIYKISILTLRKVSTKLFAIISANWKV